MRKLDEVHDNGDIQKDPHEVMEVDTEEGGNGDPVARLASIQEQNSNKAKDNSHQKTALDKVQSVSS